MKTITVTGATQIPHACGWLTRWLAKGLSGGKPVMIKLSHESRSEAQNRHMRALCNCFVKSKIDWPKGSGIVWTDPEYWKIFFVSAINYDPAKITMGLNGELINFGYSSKALVKPIFSDLIELMYAEGCERGVQWDDPAMRVYDEWGIGE